jgi:hypothetical protein
MNPKQDGPALAGAGVLVDPHGWLGGVTAAAPTLAVCTVAIVVVLCITVIVLVKSTEPSQRVAAIKALAPVLLALASRLTVWLGTWRKS